MLSNHHAAVKQLYGLQLDPKGEPGKGLTAHQHPGGDEKSSYNSLLYRQGGEWQMAQTQLLTGLHALMPWEAHRDSAKT